MGLFGRVSSDGFTTVLRFLPAPPLGWDLIFSFYALATIRLSIGYGKDRSFQVDLKTF